MNTRHVYPLLTLALAGGVWLLGSLALAQPAGRLTLQADDETITVAYGGRAGSPGIPSWKIVLQRGDGGNISDLRCPADSPGNLSANRPVTTILVGNGEGEEGNIGKGREAFGKTRAEVFRVAEKSPEKIVVRAGGPSQNKLVDQQFTYTFTAAGVRIESTVVALKNLRSVGLWPPWSCREIADSHLKAVPIRTQGSSRWASLPSSGHDRLQNMPEGVDYPVEIELQLKRPNATYVKIFYDRHFGGTKAKPMIGHNTKPVPPENPTTTIKNFAMTKVAGLPKGERDSFAYRFEFETR